MYSNPFGGMAQRPSGAMYGQQQANANPYQQMAQRRQPAQGQGGFGGGGYGGGYGGGGFGGGGGGSTGSTGQITAPTGTGGYDTRMPNPGSFNPYAQNAQRPTTGGGISTGQGTWGGPNPYQTGQNYGQTMQNMNQMGQMLQMSGADPNQMQYAMQKLMGGMSIDDLMKRLQSSWTTQGVQTANMGGPSYGGGYGW